MASSQNISISDLGDEVEKVCQTYVAEIDAETKKAINASAAAAVDSLKSYNSKRGYGIYGSSWRYKADGSSLFGYSATVYSTMPGLPHLIEFGHGGPQPAPPHPHMDKAYEAGQSELKRRMGL